MDDISFLQEENKELKKKISDIEKEMCLYKNQLNGFVQYAHQLNHVLSETHRIITENQFVVQSHLNNLRFELEDQRYKKDAFFIPQIINEDIAVQEIIDYKKSIARFGDGEFSIILGHTRHQFQKADIELGKRLKEVLQSEVDNLMIGIADNYGSLDKYDLPSANGIRAYMWEDVRREHMQLLSKEKKYYDAYLSRPYIMRKDKHTDLPKKRFRQLKKIWNKRNVIMIEGGQT